MTPVVVIAGPTASGKSALADEIAVRLGCDVISADAMQIYRGMDIGTAKTPISERRVPLRMVDVADPSEAYSAALYQREVRKIIDANDSAGKPSILCGGTGLYIKAAIDEMDFPKGDLSNPSRKRYATIAATEGTQVLYALLEDVDPASAVVIHPNNAKRIIRALEMHDEGASYAEQKSGFSVPKPHYPALQFALTMNRARLYERINRRVDAMMEQGLVDEVEKLVQRGFKDALTSNKAIGYKEIISALDGEMSMADAVELIKQRTRRYAKRQLSWFRRDERVIWLDMDSLDLPSAGDKIIELMGETWQDFR